MICICRQKPPPSDRKEKELFDIGGALGSCDKVHGRKERLSMIPFQFERNPKSSINDGPVVY